MKSHSVERIPAVARLSQVINSQRKDLPQIVVRDIKYVLEGAEKLDQEVKLKSTQIATITKEKSDLQQLVTAKTSEIQSKNSLLTQKEQLLVQKEKLLSELRIKEAERLDKAKEEYISILHQLHPHAYPANYEDWPMHIKARKLLDSGNLQAIEKNVVVYREQLKKELARQREEVQNKAQLILQKEQELKSLNDTFLTKEEIAREKLKNTEVSHKVKKVSRKLTAKDKLISDKDQEIETLKALLAQKDIETEELLARKELEKQELALQKDFEIQNKDNLLIQKDVLLAQKDIENQQALNQKDNEISGLNVQIQQLSHIDFGVQINGNEVSTQVFEVDLAGLVEPQNVHDLNL